MPLLLWWILKFFILHLVIFIIAFGEVNACLNAASGFGDHASDWLRGNVLGKL
jgi:hypothetical protein